MNVLYNAFMAINKLDKDIIYSFDVDGVLADTADGAVKLFNKKFNQNKKVNDLTDFYIIGTWLKEIFGDEKKANVEAIKIWNDDDVQLNSKPVEGSMEVVNSLIAKGNEIHFITSRPSFTKENTLKWFRNWFPEVKPDDIHMNPDPDVSGRTFKINKIREVNSKIHFEDSIEHISDIAKEIPDLHIILIRQPWNLAVKKFTNKNIWAINTKSAFKNIKLSYEFYLKFNKVK
jgi:uncharacterized HAD superfamily protein